MNRAVQCSSTALNFSTTSSCERQSNRSPSRDVPSSQVLSDPWFSPACDGRGATSAISAGNVDAASGSGSGEDGSVPGKGKSEGKGRGKGRRGERRVEEGAGAM